MTLSEVLPSVRQLNVFEKLKLIRILAEDLDGSSDDVISLLRPNTVYDFPTPYNMFGVADKLLKALESAPSKVGDV